MVRIQIPRFNPSRYKQSIAGMRPRNMRSNKQVILMPMAHVPHSEMQFLHVDLFRALKVFSGSFVLLDVPSPAPFPYGWEHRTLLIPTCCMEIPIVSCLQAMKNHFCHFYSPRYKPSILVLACNLSEAMWLADHYVIVIVCSLYQSSPVIHNMVFLFLSFKVNVMTKL